MAVSQVNIIEKIASERGISKREARELWFYMADLIKGYLDNDENVKIPNIGILKRKFEEAHLANAPGKDTKVSVPARYAYKLKTIRTLVD